MLQELRGVLRDCMATQVAHWQSLDRLERVLTDTFDPGDVERLNRGLVDQVAILGIELNHPEQAHEQNPVSDGDIDDAIALATRELGVRVPRSWRHRRS